MLQRRMVTRQQLSGSVHDPHLVVVCRHRCGRRWQWAKNTYTFLTSLTRATSTYTCFHSHRICHFWIPTIFSDQTLVLPPTHRCCLLTPMTLHHDLALFRLLPCYSAIPTTLPITCVCRCGCYYYRVRCRLIFRSRALSVVYGTALAPASTSFFLSFLSSPFSFFFTSFPLDACRTLFPKYFRPLRTYSITIDPLPPPSTTRTTNFFFSTFFSSQVDYIYPVSFSSAVYSLLYPCILSRYDQRKKVYYSFVKATNLLSLSHSVVLLPPGEKLRWTD